MNKITKTILDIYYKIPMKIFLKNSILLESSPDFSDSTKYVYDELIRRKINEKYKIVWFVKNPKKFKDINDKNVKFLKREGNILYLIRFYYYNFFSRYIIDCNYYIRKYNKEQFRIYIQHGNAFKRVSNYGQAIGNVDYLVSTSHFFDDELLKIYPIKREQLINVGFPRDDILFRKTNKKNKKEKIVVWMPTYRNHKNDKNGTFKSNLNYNYGVPCIENEDELLKLNSILKKNKIRLILKLHPAEDLTNIKNVYLSNIELWNPDKYLKKYENIYDFLPETDGLLTDYSSIYFDYTVTYNKIGLVVPDLEEYSTYFELCFKNYKEIIKGDYIYNFNELCQFFEKFNISKIDKKERKSTIDMFFDYQDDKSSKRVVDLLEGHMEGQ